MKSSLNVKFYPEKNVKRKIFHRKISRIALIALIVNALIAIIYILDVSGFELEKISAKFTHWGTDSAATLLEKDTSNTSKLAPDPSFFAGHSYPIDQIDAPLTHEDHAAKFLRHGFNSTQDTAVMGYYGIDVSHWQNTINWSQVHSDTAPSPLKFFIMKATQGTSSVDPYFKRNWASAKTQETTVGAYHFYLFNEDPKQQAAHYINTVPLQKGDFLPIVDIEPACSSCGIDGISKADLIANLTVFLNEIEAHFEEKPILYTYTSFHNEYLKGAFSDYTFWMAQYSPQPPLGFALSNPTSTQKPLVAMWQFSFRERIQGIVGNVDMSFLPKDQYKKMIYFAN